MRQTCTAIGLLGLLLAGSVAALAQEAEEPKPVPIITGYAGFNAKFEPNKQTLNPTLNPIVLLPLGRRLLVEAEFEMESDIEREDGVWGPKVLEKGIEYLQLDWIAHRHLTVVVGRFLTPFGIFNERLHPNWIKNVQEAPIIFGLSHGSSTGAMLRGGVRLSHSVDLNYAAYFSTLSTQKLLEADRAAGGRWSLFFPNQRFEAGFSFKRTLGPERFNSYGGDATWTLRQIPLEFHGEYTRSEPGSGYWIEAAYRLSRVPHWRAFFRRSQPVIRFEQFFLPETSAEGGEEMVADINTQRAFFGWNYYLKDGLKASFAYGREFTREGDHNVWTVGIAYRFLY